MCRLVGVFLLERSCRDSVLNKDPRNSCTLSPLSPANKANLVLRPKHFLGDTSVLRKYACNTTTPHKHPRSHDYPGIQIAQRRVIFAVFGAQCKNHLYTWIPIQPQFPLHVPLYFPFDQPSFLLSVYLDP